MGKTTVSSTVPCCNPSPRGTPEDPAAGQPRSRPRRHRPARRVPACGAVVRRVLLRRNIVVDVEPAQLVTAAVQAALQAGAPSRPPRPSRRVPAAIASRCSDNGSCPDRGGKAPVRCSVLVNIGGGQVPQVGECCGRSGTFRRPGHWQTLISAAATARWVFSCSADAGSWRAGAGGLLGVPRRDGVNYWNHIWREVPCLIWDCGSNPPE